MRQTQLWPEDRLTLLCHGGQTTFTDIPVSLQGTALRMSQVLRFSTLDIVLTTTEEGGSAIIHVL